MLFNMLWETTLQQHVPPASLSRVSAYDWFGSLLGDPLGLALAGVAAAAIGMSRTLWIAAAVDLASVVALLAAPSVRNLRRIEGAVSQDGSAGGQDGDAVSTGQGVGSDG
jgi:hypothetical protein